MEHTQQIKTTIMQVTQGLKKSGLKVSQNQILNIVAEANGFKNWSAYTNSAQKIKKSKIFHIEYQNEKTYIDFFNIIKDSINHSQDSTVGLNENTLLREILEEDFFQQHLFINYNVVYRRDRYTMTNEEKDTLKMDTSDIQKINKPLDISKSLKDISLNINEGYIDIQNIKMLMGIPKKSFAKLILRILEMCSMQDSYTTYEVVIDKVTYDITALETYITNLNKGMFIPTPKDITSISRIQHLLTLEKEYTTIIDNGQQIMVFKCNNFFHLHTAQHSADNLIYISKHLDKLVMFALSSNVLDCVGDIEKYYFFTNPMVRQILDDKNFNYSESLTS